MKLVAIKKISQRRPLGAIFDESAVKAKFLIKLGVAKVYEAPAAPTPEPAPEPAAVFPDQAYDILVEPPAPVTSSEPPRGRRGRARG